MTSLLRPKFGTRPNREAILECEAIQQRTALEDGTIPILDDFRLYQYTLVILLCQNWLFRGMKEHHELTWSRFKFGTYDVPGPLFGRRCVQLMPGQHKTAKLLLTCTVIGNNET